MFGGGKCLKIKVKELFLPKGSYLINVRSANKWHFRIKNIVRYLMNCVILECGECVFFNLLCFIKLFK